MLVDARSLPSETRLDTEVCVVGAGIAGILISLALAARGHGVTLLEAGGSGSSDSLRKAQAGDVSGTEHEPLEDVSVRRLGGALALWGGRLLPLDERDFLPNSARADSWPIRYDDLQPFYLQANEALHGGRFEYTASEALSRHEPLLFTVPSQVVTERKLWRWGPPLRYKHFHRRIASSQRLHLLYHCLATEIISHREQSTCRYVRAASRPGRHCKIYPRVLILAGGGLETTRLLLASRAGRIAGLGNEHRQVGANYLTHPVAEMGFLTVSPHAARRLCKFEKSRDNAYCRRILSLTDDALERWGLPNINVTFWSPDPHDPSHGDGVLSAYALTKRFLITRGLTNKVAGAHRAHLDRAPASRQHVVNILRTLPESAVALAAWSCRRWLFDRQIPALVRAGRSGTVRLRFDAEQRRDSANFAELSDETDAYGVPRLRVRYRVSDADRNAYFDCLDVLRREIHECGVGELTLPDRDAFVGALRMGDGTHQMGLTRMSSNARDGVVDADCRLHGSRNVFIASTAVFPTSGAAPPTLTLAALALRLARRVEGEMASGE